MTLVMVIMICVGCALILAGLAVAAFRAIKLARAAREAGLSSADEVVALMRRGREVGLQAERLAAKQKVVAERLQSLSATTTQLSYLRDQLDEATGHLLKLKS